MNRKYKPDARGFQMNRQPIVFIYAALACLLATAQAGAADAPAAAKSAPPALVLVPEPRPAPMPAIPVAPKAAMTPPAAPSFAPARPMPVEVLPQMPSGRSHTVAAGESLDRVIQKTMADSPLKTELIRQAFVQLNPQAFPNGRVVRLKAGTVLQVPDAAQLLRNALLPVLEGAEAAAVVRNGTPQAADEKRRWVRFP